MSLINELNLNVGFKIEICIQIKVFYVCLVKTHRQTKTKHLKTFLQWTLLLHFKSRLLLIPQSFPRVGEVFYKAYVGVNKCACYCTPKY